MCIDTKALSAARVTKCPTCWKLRDFLGCGTFSVETVRAPGKAAQPLWAFSVRPSRSSRSIVTNCPWAGLPLSLQLNWNLCVSKELWWPHFSPYTNSDLVPQVKSLCPSKIHMLNSNTHCDGIWRWCLGRWLSHEGETHMNGNGTLIKENPESSPAPPPCEDTDRRLWSKNQKTGPRRHWICWYLTLELPSLQNCEKYSSVVYKPPTW